MMNGFLFKFYKLVSKTFLKRFLLRIFCDFKSFVIVCLDKDVHKIFHRSANTIKTDKSLKIPNYPIQAIFKSDVHP